MMSDKTYQIIEKVKEMTEAGKIEWEPTEKDDAFQASFADFTIRILLIPTRHAAEGNDVVFEIYNSNGNLVESADDVDMGAYYSDSYADMNEFYDTARGYALGVEQTLDSIIETLKKKDDGEL